MFGHELTDVEGFEARAVNVVQIERRRIQIGDSDAKSLAGLVPVTRPIRDDPRSGNTRGHPPQRHRGGSADRESSASGDEEESFASQLPQMTVGRRPNHGGKSQGNPHPLPPPTGEDQPSTNRAGARGQGSGAGSLVSPAS